MNSYISELTEEVWCLYEIENGGQAKSIFEAAGIPLTAISELPGIACHQKNINNAIDFFLSRYRVNPSEHPLAKQIVREILSFEHSESYPLARNFITTCSKLYLGMWRDMHQGQYKRPRLPKCFDLNSALIDLASGPEFVNFFPELDPTTTYYAVDSSFFAIECVRLKAEAAGLDNVIALHKDVTKLTRTDIPTSRIEVVRAKNIFAYVPYYLSAFQSHLDWLSSNGRFIFAESAFQKEANDTFKHDLVMHEFRSSINNGWGFTYSLGESSNPLELNNVSLLKNNKETVGNNLRELQKFYIELDRKYYGAE